MKQQVTILAQGSDLSKVEELLTGLCPSFKPTDGVRCFGVSMELELLDPPYPQEDFPADLDMASTRIQISLTSIFALEKAIAPIAVGISEILSERLKIKTAVFVDDFDLVCEFHSGKFVDHDMMESLPGWSWQPFVLP